MSTSIVTSLMQRAEIALAAHKYVDAIALYEVVLAREADNVDALGRCAAAYRANGDAARAVTLILRAVRCAPDRADLRLDAAEALAVAGRHDEALAAYGEARRLDPGNPDIALGIARTHAKAGDYRQTVQACRMALALVPGHRLAAHHLGQALVEIGAFDEAVAVLSDLVAADPGLAAARADLALLRLRLGDYTGGFRDWTPPEVPADAAPARVWDGRPFADGRLLIRVADRPGDVLPFLRFVAPAKSLGGEVVLLLPRALSRLGATVPGADRLVVHERDAGEVTAAVSLFDLPARLGLTLGAVGMRAPYVAADAGLAERWSARLALRGGLRTIGLVWRGNARLPADRWLAGPADLAPFAALSDTRLIALQKLSADEIVRADTPSGWAVAAAPFRLEHPGPDFEAGLDALADTAAVMSRLDLLVSVAAPPLHLAGALGRPAIALLKAVPDWLWLSGRADSPWYPSLRLERQAFDEGVAPVVARALAAAAAVFAGARAPEK